MEDLAEKLARLLNSEDPLHVAQGLQLAEALEDLEGLDALPQSTWTSPGRFQRKGSAARR